MQVKHNQIINIHILYILFSIFLFTFYVLLLYLFTFNGTELSLSDITRKEDQQNPNYWNKYTWPSCSKLTMSLVNVIENSKVNIWNSPIFFGYKIVKHLTS